MKLAIIFLSSLAYIGCTSARDSEPRDALTSVVEGTTEAPDGLRISYDVRGKGDTTLFFVHCWACDRSFWREQLDAFKEDYRVVALDLGGHGRSGTERKEWTIESLAGDVQAVADVLELERFVLIGHSLGGPVSLKAASLMPGRVEAVVCVDTLHDAELEPPKGMVEQVQAALTRDFEQAMESFGRAAFHEGADPTLVEWVIEKSKATPREPALGLMIHASNFDLKEALSQVKVPVRCINAAPNPPATPRTAIETNRKYADFGAVIMEDVGHFLLLERPQAFNEKLREVLASLTE